MDILHPSTLSRPGYIYLVGAVITTVIYYIFQFSGVWKLETAAGMGLFSKIGLLILTLLLFALGIFIVTWVIEKIASTKFKPLAWFISIVFIFIHILNSIIYIFTPTASSGSEVSISSAPSQLITPTPNPAAY
jgi:asparagine N-glycosylation enzyme membrane subunit Stt3